MGNREDGVSYANISFNPSDLEVNRVYLDRLQDSYVEDYKQQKFKNNSEDMDEIMQDLVYAYITNVSNCYSAGINYSGKMDEQGKYPLWLQKVIAEKVKWEQYFRLDSQSLLYTYLVDGVVKVQAYSAGRFYIDFHPETGLPFRWVIRTGFARIPVGFEDYDISYQFKKFEIEDGIGTIKKYSVRTDRDDSYQGWDLLPPFDSNMWVSDDIYIDGVMIEGSFNPEIPPFVLLGDDLLQGKLSALVKLENEISCGDAYAILGLQLSILYKAAVLGNVKPSDFEETRKGFGIQFKLLNLPSGVDFKMLQQPTNENAGRYKDYFQRIMRFMLQGDGGDPFALFPDMKVESGTSRQLQMQNIEVVRKRYIAIYLEKEYQWWEIVQSLVEGEEVPEDIYFNPLPIGITKSEAIDMEKKELENVQFAYENGAITEDEKVQRMRKIGNYKDRDSEDIKQEKMDSMEDVEDVPDDFDEVDDGNDEDVDEVQ